MPAASMMPSRTAKTISSTHRKGPRRGSSSGMEGAFMAQTYDDSIIG